jgi:hypothetical protein
MAWLKVIQNKSCDFYGVTIILVNLGTQAAASCGNFA